MGHKWDGAYERTSRHPLDMDLVRQLYCEDKLSLIAIANQLGCSDKVVRKHLVTMDIPIRNRSDSAIESCKHQGRHLEVGTKRLAFDGYIEIKMPTHPKAKSNGFVAEHILIWEKVHNRPLPVGWVIHHLNGIKNDNRPRNLEGMPKGEHHSKLLDQSLKKRIRELEVEVKLLEKALEANQLIFNIGEN